MKLTRTSFLKMLGVSPFVAKALLSDGTASARTRTYQDICRFEGGACVWAGKCSETCDDFCAPTERSICNRCKNRNCPGVCEVEDAACAGPGCTLACLRACGRREVLGECPSCSVCRP